MLSGFGYRYVWMLAYKQTDRQLHKVTTSNCRFCVFDLPIKCHALHSPSPVIRYSPRDVNQRSVCGPKSESIRVPIRAPANFNLWEEEKAQPLYELLSNEVMDCRFRRTRIARAKMRYNLYNFLKKCKIIPICLHIWDFF